MRISEIRKRLKNLYEVDNVENGYWYWFWKLFNICTNIFYYDGLPAGIEGVDIENNLILLGYAAIIPIKDGSLFAPFSHIFDFDKNYQPTKMVYANPKIFDYHTYKIGTDCEIIYNTSLRYRVWTFKTDASLYTFIGRYARLLADLEATADIYTQNQRATVFPVAGDESIAASIKAFFDKLAMGERAVVSDNSIINQFRTIEMGRSLNGDKINDWLVAKDKILEQFFRDIGIRMYNPKKAQVTEEELQTNDQLLVVSLDDMLKAREKGIEKVNDMYGTDIKVYINPKYDIKKNVEVVQDGEI